MYTEQELNYVKRRNAAAHLLVALVTKVQFPRHIGSVQDVSDLCVENQISRPELDTLLETHGCKLITVDDELSAVLLAA